MTSVTSPLHHHHHPPPSSTAKGAIDQGTLHEQALDKLRYLEQKARPSTDAEESTAQAPVFTQPVRDVRLVEGQSLHFEARLIPVGDSNLRVEWFKNGVPLQQGLSAWREGGGGRGRVAEQERNVEGRLINFSE